MCIPLFNRVFPTHSDPAAPGTHSSDGCQLGTFLIPHLRSTVFIFHLTLPTLARDPLNCKLYNITISPASWRLRPFRSHTAHHRLKWKESMRKCQLKSYQAELDMRARGLVAALLFYQRGLCRSNDRPWCEAGGQVCSGGRPRQN